MKKRVLNQWLIGITVVAMVCPLDAAAGKLSEYLDALDLNDYSLAGNLYASSSPYAGADNFYIAYPAFSSFEHATVTEHTLYIRDADTVPPIAQR